MSFTVKAEENEIEGTHAVVFVGKAGNVSIESWKALHAPGAKSNDKDKSKTETPDKDTTGDKTTGPEVNPYEAVSTGLSFGKTEGTELVDYNGKKVVSSIESGDYFAVNNVNFKNGANQLTVLAKSDKVASVEVRDGSVDRCIGSLG